MPLFLLGSRTGLRLSFEKGVIDGGVNLIEVLLKTIDELMQEEGYGRGYAYDHDATEAFSGQNYFPDALERQKFYDPPERGFEREIRKRLEYWAKLRKERGGA